VPLAAEHAAELHRRTEGWPAGLFARAFEAATEAGAPPLDPGRAHSPA
jgi:hypothetical protein